MIGFPLRKKRLAAAVVLAGLLVLVGDWLARAAAHQGAENTVTEYLTVGLTPYALGDDTRPPDDLALYLWMHQVGPQLEDRAWGHWASPGQMESLSIVRIGATTATHLNDSKEGQERSGHTIQWQIGENRYEAAWSGEYARNPPVLIAIGGLAFVAFVLVGWWLPPPLNPEQQTWYDRLLDAGVEPRNALQTALHPRITRDGVSDQADQRFEELRSSGVSAEQAMDWALSDECEELSDKQWAWFLVGLSQWQPDLNRCLDLARAPDSLVIHFDPPSLVIKGINVPLSSGPLTYYALYALHRTRGEGWLENPQRGAKVATGPASLQQEFLDLCEEIPTHAKAAENVRTKGISAKDLGNNRSRINDAITGTLTTPEAVRRSPELNELVVFPYLFESQPVPGKDHHAFRIRLDPENILLKKHSPPAAKPATSF